MSLPEILRKELNDLRARLQTISSNDWWTLATLTIVLAATTLFLLSRTRIRNARPHEKQNIIIDRLMVHPLKSCMACNVDEVKYGLGGFDLDRKWMVYDVEKNKPVSARDNRGIKLVKVKPTILRDPNSSTGGVLRVSFPPDENLEDFEVDLYPTEKMTAAWELRENVQLFGWSLSGWVTPACAPTKSGRSPSEILSQYLGRPVLLLLRSSHAPKSIAFFPNVPQESQNVLSFADVTQGMLISRASLRGAEKIAGGPLALERYRPNVFVKGVEEAFGEDHWVEVEIGVGRHKWHVPNRTPRCMFPSVDPISGERDGIFPHRQLLKARRIDKMNPNRYCLGIYIVPRGDGVLRVGDKVQVTKSWVNPELHPDNKSNAKAEKDLVALAAA